LTGGSCHAWTEEALKHDVYGYRYLRGNNDSRLIIREQTQKTARDVGSFCWLFREQTNGLSLTKIGGNLVCSQEHRSKLGHPSLACPRKEDRRSLHLFILFLQLQCWVLPCATISLEIGGGSKRKETLRDMSSSVAEAEAGVFGCCANCGMPEVDEIKLEECDGCDLVKYCGGKCRGEHREQHEEDCRKRKEELHDRELFTQPDINHLGECPICFLPLSLDRSKSFFKTCCSEIICNGCFYANVMANKYDKAKALRCPFCREPHLGGGESKKRIMKRVKANDPAALRQMGLKCYDEGDYDTALEYLSKSAELGDAEAHYRLGRMYEDGEGVEKDMEKAVHHLKKAAIGGHPEARNNIACIEGKNGNMERSAKHFIISAKLGCEQSMKALWKYYSLGNITKEDLDVTLRTHQAAIDATKSDQREKMKDYVSRSEN
jgi:hypothetical protein